MFENITIKELFLQDREEEFHDRKNIEELIDRAEAALKKYFKDDIIEIQHHISLPDNIFCVAAMLKASTDFLEATRKMDEILLGDKELTRSCVYPYFAFEDFNGDIMYYLKNDIESGQFE